MLFSPVVKMSTRERLSRSSSLKCDDQYFLRTKSTELKHSEQDPVSLLHLTSDLGSVACFLSPASL